MLRGLRHRRASVPPTLFIRTFLLPRRPAPPRTSNDLDIERLWKTRSDYDQHRLAFLMAGAAAGIISMIYLSSEYWRLRQARKAKEPPKESASGKHRIHQDSLPGAQESLPDRVSRKLVLHDEKGREVVDTGNTVVRHFPRNLQVDIGDNELSTAASSPTDFTLVGLGMRSVTLFGIHVYLVGFYVAKDDIDRMQTHLVKQIHPLATTLLPSERDDLRAALLDPVRGVDLWDSVLQKGICRTAIRIAPVRDSSLGHLRDGFLRAIKQHSQREGDKFTDDAFSAAITQLQRAFSSGSARKGMELLLCRRSDGALTIFLSGDKPDTREVLGQVQDERVSRLLWMNYLAGKNVASEVARQHIVHGIMQLVERPSGTLATQVL